MYEKTFKVWASGCAHVNADKKMGRDSLGEAIIDSEKYFNWDIGINIGDFSRVGANSVVTKSVPNNVTVAGIPAREFAQGNKKKFQAYGFSSNESDPREKKITTLLKKIEKLEKDITSLKK